MTCTLGSLSASIFGGSASIWLLSFDSDGSKVCASYVEESSKLRTYKIHKNLTDKLLKSNPTEVGGRGVTRLDVINYNRI